MCVRARAGVEVQEAAAIAVVMVVVATAAATVSNCSSGDGGKGSSGAILYCFFCHVARILTYSTENENQSLLMRRYQQQDHIIIVPDRSTAPYALAESLFVLRVPSNSLKLPMASISLTKLFT